jgi:hypothetical protein
MRHKKVEKTHTSSEEQRGGKKLILKVKHKTVQKTLYLKVEKTQTSSEAQNNEENSHGDVEKTHI